MFSYIKRNKMEINKNDEEAPSSSTNIRNEVEIDEDNVEAPSSSTKKEKEIDEDCEEAPYEEAPYEEATSCTKIMKEMGEDSEDFEEDESSNTSSCIKKDKFEVKKLGSVISWAWDIVVDNCAICHNHIMDLCMDCRVNSNSDTECECRVAWGACEHCFHFHCISRWLKVRYVCPLDNKEWEFKKDGE